MVRKVVRKGRPTLKASSALNAHVVAVAERLFTTHGFRDTSMTKVAAEARVGKQTLYRRFENKAALFREVMIHRIQRAIPTPDVATEEGDPVAELRSLARMALEVSVDPGLIKLHRILVSEVTSFPELADYATTWGSFYLGRGEELLQQIPGFANRDATERRIIVTSLFWSIVGDAMYRTLMGEPQLTDGDSLETYFAAKWQASIFGIRFP